MKFKSTICFFVLLAVLGACKNQKKTVNSEPSLASSTTDFPIWVHQIDNHTMIGSPEVVNCILSGGTQTQCVSFTLRPQPASFEIGPWCPRNIADGSDVSGIWLDDGKVYDVDGQFIQNLASFYEDNNWQLFDPETGLINVTDSKVSCEAAARPNVDPVYQNHCVECQMSYLAEGTSMTYVIPIIPEKGTSLAARIDHAGVGIAFSGARLDAAAPVEAILSAYTIAAFDDCGGHINPNVGYHIHAVTDANCLKGVSVKEGHALQIGVAMDGYPLHNRFNLDGVEPAGLDQCRGHDVEGIGYHYHVNDAGANAILQCHTGQTGCVLEGDDVCNASVKVRRGPPPSGGAPPRP